MNSTDEKATLSATVREQTGKQLNQLRQQGVLPVVIYGDKQENLKLKVDYREFETVYRDYGSSSLVDLRIDGQPEKKVLIQEVQRDPVSDRFIHADLRTIDMHKKITAEAHANYIGISPAVKEQGGVLVKNFDTFRIECLPQDLVKEIDVDISPLQTFDDVIRMKNITLPSGVTLDEEDGVVVAKVQPPRTEAELEALEEKPEEEVGVVEKVGDDEKEEKEGEVAEGGQETKEADEKKQADKQDKK